MTITDGCYSIRPYSNVNQVIDISGRSQSDSANALLYAPNAGDVVGNHQKCLVSASGTYERFTFLHSNKRLDVTGGGAVSGTNVQQYTINNTAAQDWAISQDTSKSATINGETLDVYEVKTRLSNTLCLDAESGQTRDGTNIQIYTENDTNAQRFVFVKDCAFNGGTVPANVGISTADGGDRLTQIETNSSSVSFYPTWLCDATYFQLRYRIRPFTGSSYGSWSNWKSPTGAITDDGYGNVWTYNQAPASAALQKWGTQITISSLDWTSNIRYELQISVRRFDESGMSGVNYGSGASAVQTVTIIKTPELTCTSVQMTNNGLQFTLAGTPVNARTNWKIENVICNSNLVCDDIAWQSRNGLYTVTWDKMLYLPASAAQISFTATFDNGDTTLTESFVATVSYSGGGMSISASLFYGTINAGVNVTTTYTDIVYILRYKHQGRYEAEIVDALFNPPFGDFDLYIIAENGSSWGTKKLTGNLACKSLVWDFGGETAECSLFEDVDVVANSLTREEEDFHYLGKPYHSRYFDVGGESDCSVSNAIITDDDLEVFERLKTCDYALFRTPDGYRANVAISEVAFPRKVKGYYSLSVSQKENS